MEKTTIQGRRELVRHIGARDRTRMDDGGSNGTRQARACPEYQTLAKREQQQIDVEA